MKKTSLLLSFLALTTGHLAQARELSCVSKAGQDGPAQIDVTLNAKGSNAMLKDNESLSPVLLQVKSVHGQLEMRFADDANSPVIATLNGTSLHYVFRITGSGDSADATGGQEFAVDANCREM